VATPEGKRAIGLSNGHPEKEVFKRDWTNRNFGEIGADLKDM